VSGCDTPVFCGPNHHSALRRGVHVFVIGAVVKYKDKALSMILNEEDRKRVGIVSELVDVEFVEVIWSDGSVKITFKEFIEVIK